MPENDPSPQYRAQFRAMRFDVLKRGGVSFLITALALLAWFGVFVLFEMQSGFVFLGGTIILLCVWYFGYIVKLEKIVRCPACQQSLADNEGWHLNVKTCPHCDAEF